MSKGVKFVLALIPGFIVAYIGMAIWLQIGEAMTPNVSLWLRFPLYDEQRQIIAEHGTVGIWFAIIPWAFKYFFDYPIVVIYGLSLAWKNIIIFLFGISLAGQWSGVISDPPKAE